jgi:hypothetical protein
MGSATTSASCSGRTTFRVSTDEPLVDPLVVIVVILVLVGFSLIDLWRHR